jgi:HEPN domain
MTTNSALPDPKRKWYGLALRHLRMASRLLDSGFADGTVFHTYHAYECVLSALIAANGYPVPPDGKIQSNSPSGKKVFGYPSPQGILLQSSTHKARQMFFMELADKSKPYYAQHLILSRFITLNDRMDSLYYDAVRDQLPYEVYNRSFAVGVLPQIHLFAREVWKEIR